MHALLQLLVGVRDLILLPIEQYRCNKNPDHLRSSFKPFLCLQEGRKDSARFTTGHHILHPLHNSLLLRCHKQVPHCDQGDLHANTHSSKISIPNPSQFAAELAFDVMSPDGCVVQGKLPHPNFRLIIICFKQKYNFSFHKLISQTFDPDKNTTFHRGCKRKAGRSAVRRARGTPADLREGMLGAMALVRGLFDV